MNIIDIKETIVGLCQYCTGSIETVCTDPVFDGLVEVASPQVVAIRYKAVATLLPSRYADLQDYINNLRGLYPQVHYATLSHIDWNGRCYTVEIDIQVPEARKASGA